MAKVKDIILGDNAELMFRSGDLFIHESDDQHVLDILEASPGHYKQHPLLGVGIENRLNGPLDADFSRQIRLMLESDGYSVENIKFNDNKNIQIYAERENYS